MTLHDIENALPPIIRFNYCKYAENTIAGVEVCEDSMGTIYDFGKEGFYYYSECYPQESEYYRRDTFLSYFNYELLLSVKYNPTGIEYQIYKIEPKFRIVYK